MNFTGTVDGRDDVHVLVLEDSDGWRYEVRIDGHPIYGTHPYRDAQKFVSCNDALGAGRRIAKELSRTASSSQPSGLRL